MADTAALPTLPFEIASQYSTRPSFQVTPQTLQASSPTTLSPIQIPAVGFLQGIMLEVTVTATGGTAPALTADGPFNIIESINFRNAAGVNLISPVKGYDLYLMNKYGSGQVLGSGHLSDARVGKQYTTSGASSHFFLWLPLGIDPSQAYGALPGLASNANYQTEITLAAVSRYATGAPSLTVSVNATAHYFDMPVGDSNGVAQATTPPGTPAMIVWQKETPTVSPGTQLVQSYNIGNVIRTHILVLRDSTGARIDTNGWPGLLELYLDNQPRFSLSKNEHEYLMSRWHGLDAASKDVAKGLDTGVYALPYHALLGSVAGDPANTRAQLLPTLTATLLQFRAQDFGSAASRLEILTQSVTTTNAAFLFDK